MTKKGKKLKFVFVTEYFPSQKSINVQGGVEIRTYYLARFLAKKYQVTVIASKEKNKPDKQTLDKIRIKRLGVESSYKQKGKFLARISFIFYSIRECLREDFDLLEGTGLLGQIVVLIVSKIKKVKCVAFVPDTFSDFSSFFGFFNSLLLKKIEKIIFKHKWNGYIAISRVVKKKLKNFGIAGDKIEVIYCGVDIDKIKKIKKNKTINPSICTISRFVTYKRIDYILRSVNLLKKTFPKIKCYIVGSGEEYKNLKLLINQLKINKYIKFYKFLADHKKVLQILKKSWVYCSASTVEGFGIATIEAMAAQTPYVIADIPVNREITESKGGLFFSSDSLVDLTEKIRKILSDTNLAKKITQDNVSVVSRYDLQTMVKKTLAYYLKLLSLK